MLSNFEEFLTKSLRHDSRGKLLSFFHFQSYCHLLLLLDGSPGWRNITHQVALKKKKMFISDRPLNMKILNFFQDSDAAAGRPYSIRLSQADPGGCRHLLRLWSDPTSQYFRSEEAATGKSGSPHSRCCHTGKVRNEKSFHH